MGNHFKLVNVICCCHLCLYRFLYLLTLQRRKPTPRDHFHWNLSSLHYQFRNKMRSIFFVISTNHWALFKLRLTKIDKNLGRCWTSHQSLLAIFLTLGIFLFTWVLKRKWTLFLPYIHTYIRIDILKACNAMVNLLQLYN